MNQRILASLLAAVAVAPAAADTTNTARTGQVEETETITYGPAEQSPEANERQALQAWAQHLAGKPGLHVEVIGHTDQLPVRARARALLGDNLNLSRLRARAVVEILRAQPGWDGVPLVFSGKGDTEPKISCRHSPSFTAYLDCQAANRRVEIRSWYDSAPAPAAVVPAVTKAALSTPVAEKAVAAAPTDVAEKPAAAVPTDTASSRFYASVDAGKIAYSGTASHYDGDAFSNPFMLRIGGGYRLNPHLALEAGYMVVGESAIKRSGVVDETLRNNAIQLAAVGSYPINGGLDLIGKLGVSYNQLDYHYADATISGSGSGSKADLMYGIGLQYRISRHHSLRAQYENFGKNKIAATFSDGTKDGADIGFSALTVGWLYSY